MWGWDLFQIITIVDNIINNNNHYYYYLIAIKIEGVHGLVV